MADLFDPVVIGGVTLRNRTLLPSMTTRLADDDGHVTDATVALNDPATGLTILPTHGSFQMHVVQKSTGQVITTTVNIDLDGVNPASDTTLTSLAADIDAAANVTARQTMSVTMEEVPRRFMAIPPVMGDPIDDPMGELSGPVEIDDMGCSRLKTIAGKRPVSPPVPS